ncbi:uncharacterized protein [Euphorbia lathyris]|uniref:uncharacterized protein isoform X2 n=1 Tax=Euphorbia lathyris TaxID=212925 RepID=UPI003313835B
MPSIEGSWLRSRRGNQMMVAASPLAEDAVIATEPLTKEGLVGYLVSGCKTKEKWRYRHEQLNTCISALRYCFEILCRRLLNLVYGLASGDPLRFKRVAGHKDLYYIDDKDALFKDVIDSSNKL